MSESSFQDILKQACELRSYSDKKLRKKYESLPIWHQNSLFSSNDINNIRLKPFDERLSFSLKLKEIGNDYYNNSKYNEAINVYEQSLSIFKWIEHKNNTETDKSWMKNTIEDDHLLYYDYIDMNHNNNNDDNDDNDDKDGNDDKDKVKSLYISCLLNIAVCYQKLNEWKNSILACDHVLSLDDENIKALYRRAIARTEPKSCGATENEMAFVDITKAYTIVNSNNDINSGTGKAVVSLYHSLRSSLKEQREKDKNNMKRLLAKPTDDIDIDAIDDNDTTESSSNHKPNMTLYDALAKVKDMESAAKSLAFDGDKKSAKQLTQKADSVKKLLEDYSLEQNNIKKKKIRAINFTNPSNDMIDNFKGIIDLKDIKMQKILNDIHEEYIRNDDLGISLSKQDQDKMMTMIIDKYFKSESKQMALHFISPLSSISMKRMIEKRHDYAFVNYEEIQKGHENINKCNDDDLKEILLSHLANDIYNHMYNNNNNEKTPSNNDSRAEGLLEMILEKYGKAFIGEEESIKFSSSTLIGIAAFILFILLRNISYFWKP